MGVLDLQSVAPATLAYTLDEIWAQALIFVILAAAWGVYSLVKSRANNPKTQNTAPGHYYTHSAKKLRRSLKNLAQPGSSRNKYPLPQPATFTRSAPKAGRQNPSPNQPPQAAEQKAPRNLTAGMELLPADFLLTTVNNTRGADEKIVTMRKLIFKELLRRRQMNLINSKALSVYAVNKQNLYPKHIQAEAIKELTKRTSTKQNQPHNDTKKPLVI